MSQYEAVKVDQEEVLNSGLSVGAIIKRDAERTVSPQPSMGVGFLRACFSCSCLYHFSGL